MPVIVRRIILAIILTSVVGAMVLLATPFGRDGLAATVGWMREAGTTGQLVAVALMIFGIPFGLPTIWLGALIGYLYGPVVGVALALHGMVAGASLAFLLSRWVLAEDVRRLIAKRHRWRALSESLGHGWQLVALLRIWAPHNILNLVLGASHVRFRDFAVGTAIGAMPSVGLATIGGAFAPNASQLWRAVETLGPWSLVLVGLGVIGLVVAVFWIKRIAKRAFERIQAQQAAEAGTSE